LQSHSAGFKRAGDARAHDNPLVSKPRRGSPGQENVGFSATLAPASIALVRIVDPAPEDDRHEIGREAKRQAPAAQGKVAMEEQLMWRSNNALLHSHI
jgi:hypothetical protein